MEATNTPLHLTLTDVAALARVQRPVVSMWRKRSAESARPFPAPSGLESGRELFDADQVGAWLEATGRGNNAEARFDAAAFATPTTRNQRAAFNALTALLALKVVTDRQLAPLGADQLLDIADECDPDDRLLYSELEALRDELPALARYADRLTDSAYSAAAAFEGLLADRFRAGLREHADTALTTPALSLVAVAATALAATLDGRPAFVDPTPGGGGDLLVAVVREHAEATAVSVLVTDDDAAAARLLRRRLAVHGADTGRANTTRGDGLSVAGPAVQVVQYPSPGNPGATAEEILAGIEDVVLQMDDAQRAVLIAPSRLLSDPLAGAAGNLRGDLLRSGRVRAVIQLPPGLLKAKPREQQALWILGPSFAEVPIGDRWTMVADLSTRQLTQDVSQDLVSDVVASMGDRWTLRAHSFRFARLIPTRTLLAGRGSLVAAAAPAGTRVRGSAETALRIDELLRSGNFGYTEARLVVEPAKAPAASSAPKVEDLLRAGTLRYIKGNRVPEATATKPEGTRLFGPAELLNPHAAQQRCIDLLEFAAGNPSGRLTEPGDVVFCTSPRPAALVDTQGGSAVVFPARVLRIDAGDPGGLLPDVVAADINALPTADKSWRQWRLRRVPEAQRTRLTESLARLQHGQHLARERIKRLEELATLITDGVAGGSLTLTDPSTKLAGPQTEGIQ